MVVRFTKSALVDAVIFDAGETLLHPYPSYAGLLARFISEHGHPLSEHDVLVAEDELANALSERGGAARGWSLSPEASRDFWTGLYRGLLAHLGIDDGGLPDAIYERFVEPDHYALFDDTLPALRDLKSRGYRLGLISNWQDWLESRLAALDVAALLDTIVVSAVEGVEKPDPRIFELALRRLGVEPSRACYVGDNPVFDAEPADALGMHAVLIDRRGRLTGSRWPVVASLADVARVLDS